MNANTQPARRDLPARAFRPSGGRYHVTSDKSELPCGSRFITLLIAVEFGDLALFAIGETLKIGRWFPGVAGRDFIGQPKRLIEITGLVPFRIIGAIVPIPDLSVCASGTIKPWSDEIQRTLVN